MHSTEPRSAMLSGAGCKSSAQLEEHHMVIHASSLASFPKLSAAIVLRYRARLSEEPTEDEDAMIASSIDCGNPER